VLLNIEPEVITPEVMTIIAWLKNALSGPTTTVREYEVDGNHCITIRRKVYRVIVARTYYQAQQHILKKQYKPEECSVTLCNSDDEFEVPTIDAIVEVII
jgi:hypothetical protein